MIKMKSESVRGGLIGPCISIG